MPIVAVNDALLAASDAFLLGDLLGDSVALSDDAFLFNVLVGDVVAVDVALLLVCLAAFLVGDLVAADFLLLLGLATLVVGDLAAFLVGSVAFDDAFSLRDLPAVAFKDPSLVRDLATDSVTFDAGFLLGDLVVVPVDDTFYATSDGAAMALLGNNETVILVGVAFIAVASIFGG